MIRAGISIRAAIEGIADQVENPKFKKMLVQMKKDVESGKQFSDALMRYPKSLQPALHQHGEGVGTVRRLLQDARQDRRLPRPADRNRSAWSSGAMIYPGIIGTMAIGTTIFLLTFVLPRFMVIFKGKEAALPAPTKLLLAMSNFMVNYWYVLLVGRRRRRLGLCPDAPHRLGPALVGQGQADRPAVQEDVPRPLHQPLAAHDGPADQRRRADARHDRITAEISGNTLYSPHVAHGLHAPSSRVRRSPPRCSKSPLLPARSCR